MTEGPPGGFEVQNGTDGSKSAEQDQPGSAGDGGDQSAILSDILHVLFC